MARELFSDAWGGWILVPGTPVFCGSTNYRIDTNLLKAFNAHCWYTNSAGGGARVGGRFYFTNGSDVNVAALVQISIYKPQVKFTPGSQDLPTCSSIGLMENGWYPF